MIRFLKLYTLFLFSRVNFRVEKQKEKEEFRKQAALEALEAEQEKEKRLAKLREQVRRQTVLLMVYGK